MTKIYRLVMPTLLVAGCAQGPGSGPSENSSAQTQDPSNTWTEALCTSDANTRALHCLAQEEMSKVDAQGQNYIFRLVKSNDVALLQELLNRKQIQDLWVKDTQGRTPFFYARSSEMVNFFKRSLEFAKYAEQNDLFESTALISMAKDPGAASAFTALERLECNEGGNFLSDKYYRVENWLWKNEAINHADIGGRNALMEAVRANNALSVQALTSCNSLRYNSADKAARTALHFAAVKADFSLGRILLTRGLRDLEGSITPPMDLDARDEDGNTALHLAYKCQNKEAIAVLLALKADDQKLNRRLQTPEQVAGEVCPRWM